MERTHYCSAFLADNPFAFRLLDDQVLSNLTDVTAPRLRLKAMDAARRGTKLRGQFCETCLPFVKALESQASKQKANVVSLCCSAGIGDFGIRRRLLQASDRAEKPASMLVAVDNNQEALDVYHRFSCSERPVCKDPRLCPSATLICQDMLKLKAIDWNFLPVYHPTVLLATPPCQSFSRANRFPDRNDPRSILPFGALSIVERMRPHFVVFECVEGMLQHVTDAIDAADGDAKGMVLSGLIRILKDLG